MPAALMVRDNLPQGGDFGGMPQPPPSSPMPPASPMPPDTPPYAIALPPQDDSERLVSDVCDRLKGKLAMPMTNEGPSFDDEDGKATTTN